MVTESTTTKSGKSEPAKEPDPKPYRGNLSSAAESSDPAVHALLAQRQAHVSNASTELDPAIKEQRDTANAAIKEIDDKLADLGYTAK